MTNMDLKKLKEEDIINLYSDIVIELKEREIIRSKNVTGDLGERIAINYYTKTKGLPKPYRIDCSFLSKPSFFF